MPIHDLGYRPWKGEKHSILLRWAVIASTGIKIAARSQWIRRTVMFSWLPALSIGVFFFFYEQSIENGWIDRVNDFGRGPAEMPAADQLIAGVKQSNDPFAQMIRKVDPDWEILVRGISGGDESGVRRMVWSWFFTSFFKYSQGAMMLLLVGLIAPPLISKDVRTRAFLMYFSRPIGRSEYILGKICVPAFFVTGITMVPGLLLYIFAVLLAPDLGVLWETWDLPIRVIGASLVAIIPTCCMALMFSSLTNESRFAGFAWFAVWTLGAVAWLIIYYALVEQMTVDNFSAVELETNYSMLSLYHTIGKVQRWIFGLEDSFRSVLPSIALLSGLTVFSLVVLWRRVSAPIRI